MRHKLITIAALFAVMVAMTGTAAAIGVTVPPAYGIVKIGPGGTGNVVVNVAAGSGGTDVVRSIEVDLDKINGFPGGFYNPASYDPETYFDITITDAYSNVKTCALGSCLMQRSDGPYTWGNTETFTVSFTNNKGAANADYQMAYIGSYDVSGVGTTDIKYGLVTSDIIVVPEFPTVALPVAAVIGLVFFFQSKKRKEE